MDRQKEPVFLDLKKGSAVDIPDFVRQQKIKMVYWDLGGTLADIRTTLRERIVQKINRECNRNIITEEYNQAIKSVWKQRETPEAIKKIKAVKSDAAEKVYWKDFYSSVLRELGIWRDYPQLIKWLATVQANPISFEIFPYVEDILSKLAKMNVKVGIISNAFPSARYILEHTNLLPKFEHIILSYEYDNIKPETPIYKKAAKMAHVRKQEILFIDDRKSFVEGAERFGMKALIVLLDASDQSKSDSEQQTTNDSLQELIVNHPKADIKTKGEYVRPNLSTTWMFLGSLLREIMT